MDTEHTECITRNLKRIAHEIQPKAFDSLRGKICSLVLNSPGDKRDTRNATVINRVIDRLKKYSNIFSFKM